MDSGRLRCEEIGPPAEVVGVGGRRHQPGHDLLDPLRAGHVVRHHRVPLRPGHGQGQGDHRAGPVLAGRAVHQGGARRVRDRPQGREHRVRPVDQVGEVDRGDGVVQVDLRLEVHPGQGLLRQHLGAYVGLLLPHPGAPLAEQRELVPAYAGAGPAVRDPPARARSRCAGRPRRSGPSRGAGRCRRGSASAGCPNAAAGRG